MHKQTLTLSFFLNKVNIDMLTFPLFRSFSSVNFEVLYPDFASVAIWQHRFS